MPREDANYDKLFKVRPLLDAITKQFCEVYNPAQNLSIDEAMIAFKGRLSIKQYMQQEPIKRGIKVWCCASSENGVVESDLSSRVVKDVTRTFTGKNHHVFCDNYFSSLKLAVDSLKEGLLQRVGKNNPYDQAPQTRSRSSCEKVMLWLPYGWTRSP